ncbi:hypothetical protein VE02_03933 [Pseudogymnoascus sp. 03VT05]|nr:hypothetical protein VE02_03933 [Pseudogymnoascus sp. 03VT05]
MEGSDEETSISDNFSDRHHSSRGVSAGYFTAREHIAEVFFRTETESKGLLDTSVLKALQALSAPEPYVLYYPNEIPVDGKCNICSFEMESLPQQERALHIHQCHQKKSSETSEIQHSESVATTCLWDNCRSSKARKVNYNPSISLKQYWAHFRWHLETSDSTCRWNGCGQKLSSRFELRRHLLNFHSITTRQSPFRPQFCLQHPSLGWFTCEFAWEDHCKEHLISPQASCDLDRRHGTVVAGITCPFYLGSQKLSASDRVRQFTDRGRFNVHLQNSHYRKMKEDVNVCCPHPLCHGRPSHPSLKELKVHFYDFHGLLEKGFAVTRGVMVGGRGASKVWSESDTDQDLKEEFDLEWSQDSGVASPADDTWEKIIKQTSPEFNDDFKFDPEDPLFDLDTDQDQKEEFDFEWSEVSGFASPADDTWEKLMKQTSPESKDNFILDPRDSLFRANAIMDLDETYPPSYLDMPAKSWNLPKDFWVGTNAIVDLDEKYPLSSHGMPANSWSLPIIEDANDTSGIFQYIDLSHNTPAEGSEEVLSTYWP